ncbi:phosphoribosyl-AMP cyclohydrolase [Aliidiomarina maris]|uniref:Phosphoribosyl-AMP cyclohydrolase n=1 Tax=Aliidiomarina maris TaxID=531312 RepID=A0A327X6Y8_9GAMM|nr:phosphoribosyl-AMP cyclohydrolase [Aliidiomarina maris]MBA3989122.1 phosphoribosyl-AMP cyclohydrolase [Idiomarina sp.]MCL4410520.1 phosphoribosyl-AMP cyclohydrolase [Gammaproteobacteria bacterium]MCL5049916.1 phosphoribosyl-AMP cyclohydrolase [Bacillota bacterium]RAK01422.1 hypothetical protein B0I24_10145 [Aliidiomarina maris]RUO28264.1 phosphoribosyl-AMP cyclohydrolase [Aliidiomarina maris]
MKLVTAIAATLALSSNAFAANYSNQGITPAMLEQAQQAWGAALIQISKTYQEEGHEAATLLATQIIEQAYGYQLGDVLFKPTLASGEQTFRTTSEGALAYFVGGNDDFPYDTGFALKGWSEFGYENAAIFIHGDVAMTMGHVHLTNQYGDVTTVDKTWGFKLTDDDQLRIVLHHSSLPYSGY